MKQRTVVAQVIAGIAFFSFVTAPVTAKAVTWKKKVDGETLKIQPFAFSQLTAQALDNKGQNKLEFGADRVRIGYKLSWGKVFSKLQLDFNQSSDSKAGLPQTIKDVVAGYKFNKAAKVQVGMFKTPLGYDFNISGKKLDITKRGMEKQLVLERALGAMVSGSNVEGTGLGYDAGIFNPAERSGAIKVYNAGKAQAYAGRLRYDFGKILHAEAAYATSTDAGGPGTKDYKVWDVAVAYFIHNLTLKAEYIDGSNIYGEDGYDESVWYAHVGYRFTPRFEGVVRHYQGHAKPSDTDLGNTYFGLNIYLNPKHKYNSRIQLNYVLASGDKDTWGGLKAYTGNAVLAQYQIGF